MNTKTEIWKDVPGYEGRYQVSDLGRVKAVSRVMRVQRVGEKERSWVKPERLLAAFPDKDGYPQVSVNTQPKRVHILVALAFIGPRPDGADIAHGNGIKTDNRVGNLRYATQAENAKDREAHGKTARGEASPKSKLTTEAALRVRALRGTAKQIDIAASFGISQSQVSAIQLQKSWAGV